MESLWEYVHPHITPADYLWGTPLHTFGYNLLPFFVVHLKVDTQEKNMVEKMGMTELQKHIVSVAGNV